MGSGSTNDWYLMSRRKTGMSKPVSEKAAGAEGADTDGVAELLRGTESPGTAETVSARPSMPGSASNKEAPVKASKPKKSRKDLRALAPKKTKKKVGRSVPVDPGPTALDRVMARGINQGDISQIAPVEVFRVVNGGRAMINGRLCSMSRNARVTRLTHDLKQLRQQGIELSLVNRS